ncbi:hypothetical protein Ppa06_31070 [Planomonospora parontospora subsp. parontospora]|uniref:Uncharacterized protein n=2 Tax=Planomonospora parontospora TaxID=58119 RepID=A0AA37F5C5_9ACTN|nr:hypothetical protein GCM10010126_35160 [Planomonospora parontospora]GII09309.1 hypothetical protein Ppa06_31070 [Planomonospora parontospora subsp. parontospora]
MVPAVDGKRPLTGSAGPSVPRSGRSAGATALTGRAEDPGLKTTGASVLEAAGERSASMGR